jgi:hypothetical protein
MDHRLRLVRESLHGLGLAALGSVEAAVPQ